MFYFIRIVIAYNQDCCVSFFTLFRSILLFDSTFLVMGQRCSV